jgi:hypothetical protein
MDAGFCGEGRDGGFAGVSLWCGLETRSLASLGMADWEIGKRLAVPMFGRRSSLRSLDGASPVSTCFDFGRDDSHLYAGISKRRLLLFQLSIEEICFCFVGFDPTAPEQEAVDFIGEDQFFEFDFLRAQALHQIYCLIEGDVAVVVAVDQ